MKNKMITLTGKRPIKFDRDLANRVNKEYENMPVSEPTVETAPDLEGFFYVQSINLNVAKQLSFLGKNWFECHKELKAQGKRMLTLPEFREVLKYTQKELPEVYNDITEVRNPWRAEWIDAYFEQRKDGMYVLTGNKSKAEKLEPCLMEDSRISLDNCVQNSHTKQGMPSKKVQSGDLYFWAPINGRVAWFYAGGGRALLGCNRIPPYWDSNLGVRAVYAGEKK
jgi:hypothetical protein